MRIARVRFTVRRMMIAVAILGLLLGLMVMRARSAAYQKLAFRFCGYPGHGVIGHARYSTTRDGRRLRYHEDENFWIQHA